MPVRFPIYLDSGASRHMANDLRAFNELWEAEEFNVETAKQGDRLWGNITGNIQVTSFVDGNREINVTLYNVLFSPRLSCNLLSVSQLESAGNSIVFKSGGVTVLNKSGLKVAEGKKENGLYILNFALRKNESAFLNKLDDNLGLWHKRFGHLGVSNLMFLHKNNMVDGLSLRQSPDTSVKMICEPCIMGKQSRESFDKSQKTRSSRPLELIHSDVCGQIIPMMDTNISYHL